MCSYVRVRADVRTAARRVNSMLVCHARCQRLKTPSAAQPLPLWLPSRIDGVEVDAFELYAISAS